MMNRGVIIKKLMFAIRQKGYNIMYETSQFHSDKLNRDLTMYRIKQSIFNEEEGKSRQEVLFETTSSLQVILFLRDLWDDINGRPLNTSNEYWNKIREQKLGGK